MFLAPHPFSRESLEEAWRDVRAAGGEDGAVSGAVRHFERHLEGNLSRLVIALQEDVYRPHDLHTARLPKDDGTFRLLHVPPIVDRVVERSILDALTPLLDPVLSEAAHAYRPGRGVSSAVNAVVTLREAGLGWIARGDVDECFPSILPASVLSRLDELCLPPEMMRVIERLLGRTAKTRRPQDRLRGIPQGSPLSPLFMNLVLTPFDEALLGSGVALVRYADDFVIGADSAEAAERALVRADSELGRLGLTLNTSKTEVTSFDIGFSFLGEDFGPRYPTGEEGATGSEPHTIFVGRQGARVRNVRGRVIVQSEDDVELLNVPESKVGRLVLAGSVGLSAGARSWALINDVPVTLLSRNGSLLGTLAPAGSTGHLRRVMAQANFAREEPERALSVARTMVEGKIRKQRVVLQRVARGAHGHAEAALQTMASCVVSARAASSLEALMGAEGAAASAYCHAVGSLMPETLRFEARSRRPPKDVVNAALSYGYTLLLGECMAALTAAGLDSAFGILHASEEQDRPALALDLMEEFRPWVVDAAVFALVSRGRLDLDCGEVPLGRDGVWLTSEGKKRLIDGYETRMLAPASAALPGFNGSIRRCLYRQAQRLALHISDPPAHSFTECSWR